MLITLDVNWINFRPDPFDFCYSDRHYTVWLSPEIVGSLDQTATEPWFPTSGEFYLPGLCHRPLAYPSSLFPIQCIKGALLKHLV